MKNKSCRLAAITSLSFYFHWSSVNFVCSGILFLKLPVRRGELEALEKDIANSGTIAD